MFLKKLEYILCFAAGLIVTVVNLVVGRDLAVVLFHLLIVLLAFYIFGVIVRVILQKKVFLDVNPEDVNFALEQGEDLPEDGDDEVSEMAMETDEEAMGHRPQ